MSIEVKLLPHEIQRPMWRSSLRNFPRANLFGVASLDLKQHNNRRLEQDIIFISTGQHGETSPISPLLPTRHQEMSSLRNAVARRPHKERAQPQSREKWGILEKHKDYSLRAQDYNLKKKKLAQLSEKARERNPDEFAFGMLSQGKAGLGKHKASGDGSTPLSHDAAKLLKTQDAGYLRTVAAKGRREIERLAEEVGLDSATLGSSVGTRKTFKEDDDSAQSPRGKKRTADGETLAGQDNTRDIQVFPRADEDSSTATMLVVEDQSRPPATTAKPKSKKALAVEQDAMTRLRAERKKRKRLQEMRVAKLEALKKRQREILAATDQLEMQRAKMAGTVGGVNKNGVKFKIRERKR